MTDLYEKQLLKTLQMKSEIDSLKAQLASSQEEIKILKQDLEAISKFDFEKEDRIEKLESALKRIGISAEYLSSNVNFQSDTLDSIINIAREALGPT